MPEKMSALEREHWNLAVANNNTFRRFILKYGDKTLRQISNSGPKAPSKDLFRGPEKDRYILDPKDHNLVAIDIGHFFAAAQVPLGLGNYFGALVELNQLLERRGSAFQGEDFKSNALGTIFGQRYLNDPKAGKTLREKLGNFLKDYENDTGAFQEVDVQIWGEAQTNDEGKDSKTDVSKVVTLLQDNASEVKKQYGFDVTTNEGLGKAVMQYWKENNLDPKSLKEQLDLSDAEFETASKALVDTNTTQTAKTDQRTM